MQHQGGLAGAVGTEQRDPLALVDVEVDAEERLVAVGVGERQALDVEDRGAHGSFPSYPRDSMARCTRSPRS